jgi:hypothetical protein
VDLRKFVQLNHPDPVLYIVPREEKSVLPRLLQIGDKQGEVRGIFQKANAGWPTSDEDVIAIVKSPAHYLNTILLIMLMAVAGL